MRILADPPSAAIVSRVTVPAGSGGAFASVLSGLALASVSDTGVPAAGMGATSRASAEAEWSQSSLGLSGALGGALAEDSAAPAPCSDTDGKNKLNALETAPISPAPVLDIARLTATSGAVMTSLGSPAPMVAREPVGTLGPALAASPPLSMAVAKQSTMRSLADASGAAASRSQLPVAVTSAATGPSVSRPAATKSEPAASDSAVNDAGSVVADAPLPDAPLLDEPLLDEPLHGVDFLDLSAMLAQFAVPPATTERVAPAELQVTLRDLISPTSARSEEPEGQVFAQPDAKPDAGSSNGHAPAEADAGANARSGGSGERSNAQKSVDLAGYVKQTPSLLERVPVPRAAAQPLAGSPPEASLVRGEPSSQSSSRVVTRGVVDAEEGHPEGDARVAADEPSQVPAAAVSRAPARAVPVPVSAASRETVSALTGESEARVEKPEVAVIVAPAHSQVAAASRELSPGATDQSAPTATARATEAAERVGRVLEAVKLQVDRADKVAELQVGQGPDAIRATIRVEQQRVTVHFITTDPAVRTRLEAGFGGLARDLAERGFQLDVKTSRATAADHTLAPSSVVVSSSAKGGHAPSTGAGGSSRGDRNQERPQAPEHDDEDAPTRGNGRLTRAGRAYLT